MLLKKVELATDQYSEAWIRVEKAIWNDVDHKSVTVLKLFNKYRNGEGRWPRWG